MSVIHVACAFDKAMSVPAMVLAARLKQLASPGRKTIFHALECEKDAFPTYAKYLLTSDSFEVRRHRVSIDTFRKYKLSIATVQSIATYGRLAIPQLIEEADRVLYLDCDILIKRPVGDLFDTDMRGFPLAACQDLAYLHFIRRHHGPARTSAMELLRDRRNYFNAGILLIDCVKWREQHFFEKIHALLANPPTPLFFADQDALNVVFQDNYERLDPRWNSWAVSSAFEEGEEDLARVAALCARDPWIVHFVGPAKPWIRAHMTSNYHPEYWDGASKTPFIGQLIELFESGSPGGTAYAEPHFPLISANKRVGELVCTLSRTIEQFENRLALKAQLSSRLFAIGSKIYNNSARSEADA
jgi:lipopolysaccharide biosynthesis glycosyltransferase